MRKNNKRALLVSTLSIVLCLSMLIGTTFAWFTDTDTTAVSNIVSGTLDIEIVDTKGDVKTDALDFVNKDGSNTILWEPGATFRTEGFQIKNVGSMWLKFKVEVNNTEVSYNKLNEAIDFSLVDDNGNKVALADMQNLPLGPDSTYGDGTTLYIEGTMKTTAGNEYQDLTLSGVGITVYATQYTAEVDMTDETYDENATYDDEVVTVATADEFIAAFANLKAGQIVTLTADIDMNGKAWTPVNNKSYVLNGNGKTITGLNGGMSDHTGSSEITIKDVTFDGLVDNSTTNYAGLLGDADTCSYINVSNVTITNSTIKSAKYAAGIVAYTSGYGVDNNGPVNASHNFTDVTVTKSTIEGSGSTGALIGHAGGNKATTTTINGVKVSDSTITGEDSAHTGTIIGTSHVGEVYLTYTASEVSANGNHKDNPVGRFVVEGSGKLVINGVEQVPFAN